MLTLPGFRRRAPQRRPTGPVDALKATFVVAAIALGVVIPAGVASGQTSAGAAKKRVSNIAVRVTGLPGGVAARVTVRGPRYVKRLRSSRTLQRVRPGLYTFTVGQVKIARAQKGVRAGSLALPAKTRLRVRVRAGRSARVAIKYGTIINSNVRRLDLRPLKVTGDPANPTSITLPAAGRPAVGAILAARPSAALPGGLLHHVTRVRRAGARVVVTLRPASLTEAFPQLDVDVRIHLAPGRSSVAKPRALDPVVGRFDIKKFNCQIPYGDSRLDAEEDFGVDADVALDVPRKFGIPVGLPQGRLALTLKGSASLDTLLRKNSSCGLSYPLPPRVGTIFVGPVPVPVFAQISLTGSMSIAEDFQAKASVGFTLVAGAEFHGRSVTNISSASGNASLSASGGGKLAAGPTIRFAIGVPKSRFSNDVDVHFDAQPSLAFVAKTNGECSLELEGNSQIGLTLGPFAVNEKLPAPSFSFFHCPPTPRLAITQTAPFGAFLDQAFGYAMRVTNTGSGPAHDVAIVDTLPTGGSFVSASGTASPAAPAPGTAVTIAVGDVAAGETKTVTLRWRAPGVETTLTNSATVQASNGASAGPATASVPVASTANCNPCGADAAGTGLRNRDHGSVTISGVPQGATVGRAVLVWGILFNGAVPADTITFDGHPITADVTSSVSGNLCWGDTATVGYAADVTDFVTGNGTFGITDPQRGITQVDDNPFGVLPYTDGATLVVFYNGGGADNQVLSDFSYDTDTDADASIFRFFDGIHSVGGAASLILAGPDGQSFPETFDISAATNLTLTDTWDGSDPQDGPSFAIGNLWDTDRIDVTGLLPADEASLFVDHTHVNDCIGVGATVLQVAQHVG